MENTPEVLQLLQYSVTAAGFDTLRTQTEMFIRMIKLGVIERGHHFKFINQGDNSILFVNFNNWI